MNAPLYDQPDLDGRDRLRMHIADTAGVLVAYAEILQRYCDVRDDFGIRIAVHGVALHTKAIIRTASELADATRKIVEAADGKA